MTNEEQFEKAYKTANPAGRNPNYKQWAWWGWQTGRGDAMTAEELAREILSQIYITTGSLSLKDCDLMTKPVAALLRTHLSAAPAKCPTCNDRLLCGDPDHPATDEAEGEIVDHHLSGGEPEDNSFGRDYAWVAPALRDAYKRGQADEREARERAESALREIEERTRPNGDMADQAVNAVALLALKSGESGGKD